MDWVLRHLLNDPPPPAPPNVPQILRFEGQILTARERVLAHQEEAQCASCHRKIDPIGFGLENWDAAGKWRATNSYSLRNKRGKKIGKEKTWEIDASGALHKGPGRHMSPYVYDDIKTIRDHTHLSAHGGARFYLADAFPQQYRDRLFMCNIHEYAVLTDIMEPKGSSFIGKHGDDFMPTNDLAWVGFSIETGPEGGVYLLDWHNQDICGNAIKFPNSGRVYRIVPTGAKAEPRPNLGAMSDAELVQLQTHPNDWYVRQSRTLLQYRAASGKLDRAIVHSKLNAMFDAAINVPKKLRALWALQVSGGLRNAGTITGAFPKWDMLLACRFRIVRLESLTYLLFPRS